MNRTRSVVVVAALVMALMPTAGSAQEELAEDIAPYVVCTGSGGAATCEVTDEGGRKDLELARDPSDLDSLRSPEDPWPARLICGEGQPGCIVMDESSTPEDIRAMFPEAKDLRIFTAKSDASPVGIWKVTLDDTVATCVLYGTEEQVTDVPGTALIFGVELLKDGTLGWRAFNSAGPLLKLGWGTYGFLDFMAAGPWRDVEYIAMISEDSFIGTVVGASENPECIRDWNFDGVRSE